MKKETVLSSILLASSFVMLSSAPVLADSVIGATFSPIDTVVPDTGTSPVTPDTGTTVPVIPNTGTSPVTPDTGTTIPIKPDTGTTPVTPDNSTTIPTKPDAGITPEKPNNSTMTPTTSDTGVILPNPKPTIPTPEVPVVLDNNQVITGVDNGIALLSNGTSKSLLELGAKDNGDNTYTIKARDNQLVTLPHTGEKGTALLMVLGAILLGFVGYLYKDKFQLFFKKMKKGQQK
ncbi:LPXTG cell wall anchor domain-containing protein [Streptococcus iniae]|nr:hypothetical protein BKX95_10865 [Streptococcus iniae]